MPGHVPGMWREERTEEQIGNPPGTHAAVHRTLYDTRAENRIELILLVPKAPEVFAFHRGEPKT